MKKFFSFLMVLVMSATLAIGQQMTNTEIANIIAMSQEYNREVVNPNLIFPGQVLTYTFGDGTTHTITVDSGDSQWTIVRDKLAKLVEEHGPVVKSQPPVIPETPVEPSKKGWSWWAWVIIIFLALYLLGAIVGFIMGKTTKSSKKQKDIDPTTAGPAFVPSGVSAENAANHFRALAQRSNPGANIVIKDVKPGFISTPGSKTARVQFADKTHQDLSFRNVPGFQGKVSTDGGKTFHKEYYFGACGNPVRSRRSFLENSGLIFSETPINFGDENQVAETETPAPVLSTDVVPVPEIPAVSEPIRSEYITQTEKAMKLAEKVLGKDDPHEVTFEIPKGPEGTFKMTIKAQYPQKK